MRKNIITVWQPKYSTREILIAPYKVAKGENFVRITKDVDYLNKLLKFDGSIINNYPRQKNGKGEVVCIPLSAFEIVNE